MTVFDIETDGLLDEMTKVHVLAYSYDGKEVFHTGDYDAMREFFEEQQELFPDLFSTDKTEPHRVCVKCHLNLPYSAFSPQSGRPYPRSECKKCSRVLAEVRVSLRSKTQPPPKDHLCPICLKSEDAVKNKGNKKNGAWVLDHDHHNRTARGWICHNCNRGLGAFSDSIKDLERAIEYLREHDDSI